MSGQFRVVPNDPQTRATFREIMSAPPDQPIVEMDDKTARDMEVIGRTLADLATRWRGKMDCQIPTMPANRKDYWGFFAEAFIGHHLLLPELKNFIGASRGDGKVAIDLGCGESSHTTLLLSRGWKVIAVDNSLSVLKVITDLHKAEIATGQLTVIEADATEYTPTEPVDLVVASEIFSFIDPAQFLATWIKVHDVFLKKGGTLVGSLFRSSPLPMAPAELGHMNGMKETGAWLLPDRRMVRPLLTHAGYEIKSCTFLKEKDEKEAISIQFVAEKKV